MFVPPQRRGRDSTSRCSYCSWHVLSQDHLFRGGIGPSPSPSFPAHVRRHCWAALSPGASSSPLLSPPQCIRISSTSLTLQKTVPCAAACTPLKVFRRRQRRVCALYCLLVVACGSRGPAKRRLPSLYRSPFCLPLRCTCYRYLAVAGLHSTIVIVLLLYDLLRTQFASARRSSSAVLLLALLVFPVPLQHPR